LTATPSDAAAVRLAAAAAAPPTGWRLWLQAIRPKTLTIALVPVLVGSALAFAEAGRFDALAALAAALAALLIQAATNLHNDAADFLRGGDGPGRPGPKRVTAEGWATPAQVIRAANLCFGLAALCGLYVVWVGGWPLLAVGVLSLIAGWSYTGGPRPIAYTPLGELFVLAFFGWAAVGGTYWLHAQALTPAALVAGTAIGLFGAAVLLVNNHRDADSDRRVGRRTLPVVVGAGLTKPIYLLFLAGPFALLVPLQALLPGTVAWLALLAAPLAVPLAAAFLTQPPGPAFNPLLARTARLQLAYGLLLSAGLLACGL